LLTKEPISLVGRELAPFNLAAYCEVMNMFYNPLNRLENEHLNNVGNYRAFKSVPLPFNYEDEESEP